MIDAALGTQTPVSIIIGKGTIRRLVRFVPVTQTTTATGLTTAIVIGNNIVLKVGRILTCTYPGHWRHFRAWRTGCMSASATTTEKTINCAVTPVIAGGGITGIINSSGTLRCDTRIAVTGFIG